MPGTRREFDRSLEAIEAKVVELFAIIVEDLPRAVHALEGACGETARVLAERERVIDALYLEVEHLAQPGGPAPGTRRRRPAVPAIGPAGHPGA